jgi:hypothetical protein
MPPGRVVHPLQRSRLEVRWIGAELLQAPYLIFNPGFEGGRIEELKKSLGLRQLSNPLFKCREGCHIHMYPEDKRGGRSIN